MLAQLTGTLEIDTSTNCLTVNNGITLVDVAWPPGWTVATRDNEIALIDAAGHTAGKLGDEVYVGGGMVDLARTNVVSCTGRKDVFVATGLSGP
ncbi:hypothetical protein [Kribbella jejuensis]|nr:hypothetical protein [Kribbella jejuensis]